MTASATQHIGVIDRMTKQLTETFAAFQEDKHPNISASTYAKVCGDMNMQLAALKWMRAEVVSIHGDPATKTIEGEVIRHDTGDGAPPRADG